MISIAAVRSVPSFSSTANSTSIPALSRPRIRSEADGSSLHHAHDRPRLDSRIEECGGGKVHASVAIAAFNEAVVVLHHSDHTRLAWFCRPNALYQVRAANNSTESSLPAQGEVLLLLDECWCANPGCGRILQHLPASKPTQSHACHRLRHDR